MTLFRIIGLDPGGTTGWATYTAEKKKMLPYEDATNVVLTQYLNEEWTCGQLATHDHHKILNDFLGMQQVEETLIVCESFDYRNQSKPGLELISREYIGIVKLFSQERNVPYVLQTASQGKVRDNDKSFVRKENLERLGLWVKGGASTWNHAMDAYGHILYYMIHNHIQRDELLRKGWK